MSDHPFFDGFRRARERKAALDAMQEFAEANGGKVRDECLLVPLHLETAAKDYVTAAIKQKREPEDEFCPDCGKTLSDCGAIDAAREQD